MFFTKKRFRTSCDDIAQLTHSKMVEIDFEQEDYEVIYKWPLSAKREKIRKAKALKAKEKALEKAERAKKAKATPKPPPPQPMQVPDFGSEVSAGIRKFLIYIITN